MLWPTLGSRTAKEQNRLLDRVTEAEAVLKQSLKTHC